MEELGQFDDDFKKRQEELRKKQSEFEYQEKLLSEMLPDLEAKENKKNKILTWGILFLILLFVSYLGWRLLF